MEQLSWWLAEVKLAFGAAKTAGNIAAQASLAARATALLEAKRKSAPPPIVDPNDNPDFIAMAANFRERMAKMIDQAGERADRLPKCGACGQPIQPEAA